MIDYIIIGVWLLGMIPLWGILLHVGTSGPNSRIVLNPERGFEEFKSLWYLDFDKEWSDVVRFRRNTVLRIIYLLPGSWLLVFVYIFDKDTKFKWKMDKMPDKHAFKGLVEMTRLMDPEWQNSNIKMIKQIRDEQQKAKKN